MGPFRSARVKRLSRHKQRRRCYSTVLLTRLYPCVYRLCRSRGAEASYRYTVTGIQLYAGIALHYYFTEWQYLRGAAPHPGLSGELKRTISEFHQCRGQNDLIARDQFEAKTFQDFFAIQERKHFIGALIAKFFSFVGIDMIHHAEYLPVGIRTDIGPLWDDPADELMVVLAGAFLPGRGGVAVKDMGTPIPFCIELDSGRIGELTSVIA